MKKYSFEDLLSIHDRPLFSLISEAHQVHETNHPLGEIQIAALISVKTGGCSEDCKYCAQSSHYPTSVKAEPMMPYEQVLERAKKAIALGASRICLGAAWREVRDNKQFEEILKMVSGIKALGVEVCCTLGLLKKNQAEKLKEVGLYAYNHNLDSSEEFYPTIISTRSYQDRLQTLDVIEESGLSLCCGGILGMGESKIDRLKMLYTLYQRPLHPDSIPLNRLTPVPGTPLENSNGIEIWDLLRVIATTRILFPKAVIRLSAGRDAMGREQQLLSFFTGANSLFIGEKLLTVGNPLPEKDLEMLEFFGLTQRKISK